MKREDAFQFAKNIIKLIVALLKHQAELWLGEEAVGIAGKTLVEIGGEELQEKIDKLIAGNEGAKELLDAAQRADDYFQKNCKDDVLIRKRWKNYPKQSTTWAQCCKPWAT